MKRALPITIVILVFAAAIFSSLQAPAQLLGAQTAGCDQPTPELSGAVYTGEPCPQAPTRPPSVTPGPINTPPPTSTPRRTSTATPSHTPTMTDTPTPTDTLTPTITPTPSDTPAVPPEPTNTPEPTPEHDTTMCHGAETGDGHTHGFCVEDLPAGPIRDFLEANPLFAGVGQPWMSTEMENGYPFPIGKHEGYKHLYQDFDTCFQLVTTPGENYRCLKAIWLQVHSMGTAHAARAPGGIHSLTFVAEVCDVTFTSCGIVAGGEIEHYGEIHSNYKQTGCPGVEGGVEYPEPYHIDSPPYVANNVARVFTSRPARIYWASVRGGVMIPYVGDVNNLIQVAWVENAFEVPSTDPAQCANPAYDQVWAESTDAGFINQYAIWSVFIMIDEYPRPYTGYTTREGHATSECTEPAFGCIPLYISGTVPAGDIFFSVPVANDSLNHPAGVIDITEPGVYMPGMAP